MQLLYVASDPICSVCVPKSCTVIDEHRNTFLLYLSMHASIVRANVVKNRKKSCFLDFEKKTAKNVKSVRSFTGHLITQPLITQLPEVSTGKSRSPTSNILLRNVMWTQESTQLRTVCDKRLYVTCGSFEAKISIDIQQTFFLFCNNVSIIEDKIYFCYRLFTFFFRVISKNVKSHVFFEI